MTVRCRKQDVQLVQVSNAQFSRYFFLVFLFFNCIMSLSGIHPEEYSHIQSCCEEQSGSSHRPEQLPLPGRVSSVSAEDRFKRFLVWILMFVWVFFFSALEVWRSTTAMGRSKCPTPWRAGWTSWLSRWDHSKPFSPKTLITSVGYTHNTYDIVLVQRWAN